MTPQKAATTAEAAAAAAPLMAVRALRSSPSSTQLRPQRHHNQRATHRLSLSLPRPAPRLGTSAAATAATIPSLAVPLEREGVAALPGGPAGGADEVVGAVALLAQAAVLAAGRGEAAALPVLHHRLGDPLDAGVVADGLVGGVHGDHLEKYGRGGGGQLVGF